MSILNSLISLVNLRRLSHIEEFKYNPVEVQTKQLKKLISKAEETVFGKKYNFNKIDTIADFQARVPLHYYDDLKPWISRMISGEPDVLWPENVEWFAKSSGTTSDKSKFLPVSYESLEDCHFRAARDVFVFYTENYPDSKIYGGKILTLGGSHEVSNLSPKSQVGDLSAILIRNVPFLADLRRTPDASVALIGEFEKKIEKIAEQSVKENVTSIVGVPSWNLVLLRHILKYTGKNHILEVWPNLELFVHGGISFEPYREQFRKLIPSNSMRYVETYNASEGFFAIQDDINDTGMLLMLDYGIFYEFIPVDQLERENPQVFTVENVEKGRNYAMVITTNSGLWRYIIGDTVQFTSLYPHKIKISGRTKHYINAFGEELIIDNAEKAMAEACLATGALVREYTAAPVYMTDQSKGKHQWIIEFEKLPVDAEAFAEILDKALQAANSDYEAKRHHSVTLDRLQLIPAKPGLFMLWMKQRGKLGGQNKVPRLSNSRCYVDELVAINNTL